MKILWKNTKNIHTKSANEKVSGFVVLKNMEGLFYVGRIRLDPDGLVEEYSRDSKLCPTAEEAQNILDNLSKEKQNGT